MAVWKDYRRSIRINDLPLSMQPCVLGALTLQTVSNDSTNHRDDQHDHQ
jgi:hypothetical protein